MNVKVFYRDGVKSLLLVAALMLLQSCGFLKSKFGKGGKEESGIQNGEITATARKGF